MIDDNADLVTLRRAATELAGGADGSDAVARTWAKLTERRQSAQPRRRALLTWLAVPAVAAAVLAVMLAAGAVLKPSGGSGAQPGAPSPVRTSAPSPVRTTSPATEHPTVANPDLGTVIRPVPLSQAVDAMVAAATKAGQLTFGPGQLLYQRTDVTQRGAGGALETHVYEVWTDPATMVAVRIVHDGADLGAGTAPAQVSLEYPTAAFLASLPTNPTKLYAKFAALNSGAKLGGAHYVCKEVHFALASYGPLLSTPLRVAYYGVMGLVPGGLADQIRVGGTLYYGLRDMTVPTSAFDLLGDPTTGEVAGIRYGPTETDMFHYAVVDSDSDRG